SRVPLEVAEQIIDQLHDNAPTLRSCALVCSGWLPRSRVYLFREVKFASLRQLHSLVHVLRGNPALGGMIQVV
ncbi:hypothetical protein C8Q76DRAFT_593011, partial [Earliella scabrosa]